jgi:hypothetical protein
MYPNALPLAVVITDGAPTVPLRAGGDSVRLRPERQPEVELAVTEAVRGRVVEWATLSTAQGELFDALTAHFRDELDEV